MFKCQAVDRNDRTQRATMLVNIMCHRCTNASFSAFCESLIEVEQKDIVDAYFRRTDAGSRQASGT